MKSVDEYIAMAEKAEKTVENEVWFLLFMALLSLLKDLVTHFTNEYHR